MQKKHWTAVILAALFFIGLGAVGVWQLNQANERLLQLQDQAADSDRTKPQRHTPPPASVPPPTPAMEAPKTSDFAPVDPDDHLTRAMFTAMLYSTDRESSHNSQLSTASHPFSDVSIHEWYTAAVEWAAHTDIISGTGGGLFAPDDPVTREQIAVMLCNYLRYKDRTITAEPAPGLADQALISGWALESVIAVRAAGLVPDRVATRYDPKGKVTNAEADAIFARLLSFLQETGYPGHQDLDDYNNWLPQFEPPDPAPLPVYRDEVLIIDSIQ
jgi:hypothetical protein